MDQLKNLADDPQYQCVRAEFSTLVQKYGAGANAGAAASPRDRDDNSDTGTVQNEKGRP